MHYRCAAVALGLLFGNVQTFAQPTSPPRTFRLLEWNVSDSAWLKQPDATHAILRHANPDIVVLVQVSPLIDPNGIRRLLRGLRGASDTLWFVEMGQALGIEHTVIASRDSVKALPEFAKVTFAEAGALAQRAAVPANDSVTRSKGPVELVRTNGAMVRVRGQWVFVTGIHLMCCGLADTWREYRRQLGAIAIRDLIQAVIHRVKPVAAIVAGDLNLVSGRAALDTILRAGQAAPLGPLERAEALHFDGWTDWTWDGRTTPFNGGRLDNVLYSSGRLTPTMTRIWDTEYMPADTLAAHGLTAAMSRSINQHRPVVVDFSFRE